MRLAVLLDLVGERLDAPIFGLADPASALGDDLAVFLCQRIDLRLRDILASQEDMLIEWHVVAFPIPRRPGAKPLLGPGAAFCARAERPKDPKERRHRQLGKRPSRLRELPFSLRPDRVTRVLYA